LDVKLDLGKEPPRSAPPTDDERRIPNQTARDVLGIRSRGGVGLGDLAPVFDLIFCFRTGTAAELVLRPVYFRICDFKYVSQYRPIETPLVRTSPENKIARP